MDDNTLNPKTRVEAKDSVKTLLKVVKSTNQEFKSKEVINTIVGNSNALLKSRKIDQQPFFGIGKDKEAHYWMALIRQVLVHGELKKEIEQYGVLKITQAGLDFIEKPVSFLMTEDHFYAAEEDDTIITNTRGSGASTDAVLMKMLKDLRKRVGKSKGVPPFVIFQDPSLEDMTLKYPITIEELSNVHGVGEGKAKKYGSQFVELIADYVEENDILRPDDIVVKSTGSKSGLKLSIIQNTDKKIPLEDIAKSKGLNMDELIKEMESIVFSGTKLNICYCINEMIDEESQDDIFEYFMEAETDGIEEALEEFEGDFDIEELRLMRIRFISEVGN
jgi:ATP-dependent DNA helicase RecQ